MVITAIAVGVCMSWIYYLAACGPKGRDSGLLLPLRTAAFPTPPLHDQGLSPTTVGYTGAPLSPPSQDRPTKKKRYQKDKGKGQKKGTN